MKLFIPMLLVISWAVLLQPGFSQDKKDAINQVSIEESSSIESGDLDNEDEILANDGIEPVSKERKKDHKKKKGKSKILIPPNEDDIILELDQSDQK